MSLAPILLLTALRDVGDRVSGLEPGADPDRRKAFVRGAEIPVTERELRLLERPVTGQGVSREELLGDVWGEATPEASASLDVPLSWLRRKLAHRGLH